MATPAQNWMTVCSGLTDGNATQQDAEDAVDAIIRRDWLRIIAETTISNPATMTPNQKGRWGLKVLKEHIRDAMESTDQTVISLQDDVDNAIETAKASALAKYSDEQVS